MTKRLILYFSILTFLNSCLNIQFENPQPNKVIALKKFPEKYIGKYKFLSDTLTITRHSFEFPDDFSNEYITLDSLNTTKNLKIKNHLIYDLEIDSSRGMKYKIKDDTLYYSYLKKKILFISDTVVLKSYKNNFYLSLRKRKGIWDVYLITPNNNNLIIKTPSNFTITSENDDIQADYVLKEEERLKKFRGQ